MIFDKDRKDLLATARSAPVRGMEDVPASFGETFAASADLVFSEERSDSEYRHYFSQWEGNAQAAAKEFGMDADAILEAYTNINGARRKQLDAALAAGKIRDDRIERDTRGLFKVDPYTVPLDAHDRRYLDTRQTLDRLSVGSGGAIKSHAQIEQSIKALTKVMRDSSNATLQRADTFGGKAGAFAGAMVAGTTDPLVLATLPVGAGAIRGPSLAWNAAKAFGAEAAIATLAEVPIQAQVFGFKEQIDSPWTAKDAAYNVLAAGIGAGALRATGSAAVDAVAKLRGPLTAKEASAAVKQYRAAVEAGTISRAPELDSAARTLDEYARLAETNPLADEGLHFAALDKAARDIDAGEKVDVSSIVGEPKPKPGERRRDSLLRAYIDKLDPDEVQRLLFTSEVTGLPNARALEQATSEATPPVQAMIDVDSLKFVNDTFGHQSGNELLAAVGRALREAGVDAFHISGDEFVAIGKTAAQLKKALKQAETLLEAQKISGPRGEITPRFSAGVAKTAKAAETAMLAAKKTREAAGQRAGRGQTPPDFAPKAKAKAGQQAEVTPAGRARVGDYDDLLDEDMRLDPELIEQANRIIASRGDFEVPDVARLGEGGEPTLGARPVREVFSELDDKERVLAELSTCAFPGA